MLLAEIPDAGQCSKHLCVVVFHISLVVFRIYLSVCIILMIPFVGFSSTQYQGLAQFQAFYAFLFVSLSPWIKDFICSVIYYQPFQGHRFYIPRYAY